MATKTKKLAVRRVANKEDRKRPSIFFYLKTDEDFVGYALFEPDPELDDNPGYYEYYTHWDNQANTQVPCVGEACPFCAANMTPSVRALTTWYFPQNEKGQELKVFGSNKTTIDALTDEAEDEDGILGKKLRIKRISDKGEYRVKVRADKPLTQTQLKKLLAQIAEEFDLEQIVLRQAETQLERLAALEALEDSDYEEDDEDEKPKAKTRTGKAIVKDEEEDEEEDDDETEDEEDEEEEEETEEEEEEDEDEEEAEEEEEEEEDEEENSTVTGKYTVVKADEEEDILSLKDANGKSIKMWRGDGVDIDYDKLTKGKAVNVEAVEDDEGDWIITSLKVARGRPAATK